MIGKVLCLVSIEFSASCDFVLSSKWSPMHPFSVDTQMLVGLTVGDEESLVGLELL